MPRYRVRLVGRNFLMAVDDEERKLGFRTTRVVDAPDPGTAVRSAIRLVVEDPKIVKATLNAEGDAPTIGPDDIDLLPEGSPAPPTPGYAFFPDDGTPEDDDEDDEDDEEPAPG